MGYFNARILSTIPANDVFAVFDDEGEPFVCRVLCWALIENMDASCGDIDDPNPIFTNVVGMVAIHGGWALDLVGEHSVDNGKFLGYWWDDHDVERKGFRGWLPKKPIPVDSSKKMQTD